METEPTMTLASGRALPDGAAAAIRTGVAATAGARLHDAGLHDAGLHDAGLHDAGLHDAGLHDAGLHDAGLDDAGLHDAGLHDAGLDDAGLHEIVRDIRRDDETIRAAQADQYRLIEQARLHMMATADGSGRSAALSREFAMRSLAAEIAAALGMHERTVLELVHDARTLVNEFPTTLDALERGDIGRPHVREILAQAAALPLGMRALYESSALPLALALSPAQFRQLARRLRERLHPESIAERLRRSRRDRRVSVEADRDGMSWITLYLASDQAAAIASRLEALAGHVLGDGDIRSEPRTRAQAEADVAADLLLNGTISRGEESSSGTCTGGIAAVRPTVFVTVPVLTLLGHSDEPAVLDGYGPIDAETARRLAADAPSFFRILTHPETGAFVSFGRKSYRVPAELKHYLRLRDGVCRFPGCTRRAVRCDLDHTRPWQFDGETRHDNLAHLCRKHHRLKHNSDWRAEQLPAGVIRWTSPAGRLHDTFPERSFDNTAVGPPGESPPF
ncbi:HNH endonuclease [Luethyella okanaganae]|uniref:DUF222 domain-containing protein n=1 Tax=Luethyella okanaganae TaxID=69372 RepID=A0ABW1VCB2_9MICO